MNAHPAFVFVRRAFSITSKSARITNSPVSSERRLAFVSRARSARRFRSLSASATIRSLEPKCWYRVRFVTPARAAIASTPVPVMPRSYVSSLVAPRRRSCASGRSVMAQGYRSVGKRRHRCLSPSEPGMNVGGLRAADSEATVRQYRVYRSVCIPVEAENCPLRGGPPMKAPISSDKVPTPAGPYSPGLTVGEWIFLSGQGGFDPSTGKVVSDDLADQTEQTFDNIETVLEAAGASLDDVVSCLVHLVDLADFPAFNAVYGQKFTGVKPVRTTVRADLVAGLLVEITVIARAS